MRNEEHLQTRLHVRPANGTCWCNYFRLSSDTTRICNLIFPKNAIGGTKLHTKTVRAGSHFAMCRHRPLLLSGPGLKLAPWILVLAPLDSESSVTPSPHLDFPHILTRVASFFFRPLSSLPFLRTAHLQRASPTTTPCQPTTKRHRHQFRHQRQRQL